MKNIILKLSFFFVTMSLLTSSREDLSGKKSGILPIAEQGCLQAKSELAINVCAAKAGVGETKEEDLQVMPAADLDVPLSPISRFILLQ
ncbi:MAG: hypothetical protein ABIN94_12125 [Ferruginibacter sp.]